MVSERKRLVIFTLRLKISAGASINEVAEQGIRLAAMFHVYVETIFNNIALCIRPEDTVPQVLRRYEFACAYRATEKRDAQGAVYRLTGEEDWIVGRGEDT